MAHDQFFAVSKQKQPADKDPMSYLYTKPPAIIAPFPGELDKRDDMSFAHDYPRVKRV
jgi:hypothetical protein